jgi:hypothetical protein
VPIAIAAAAAVSCQQILGIHDIQPSACGFTWASGDCASCVHASCCDQAVACAADASCSSQFACIAQCGDETCRARCVTGGDATMAALGACQSRACSSACGLACGGWGLLPGPQQLKHIESTPGCTDCLASTACAQLAACMADEACLASRFCANACGPFDTTCQGNCGYPFPLPPYTYSVDGGGALSNGALLGQCQSACALGSDWTCLGHVTWPMPQTPTVTVLEMTVDYNSDKPIAGATVSACGAADLGCSAPVATATTGPDGIATLSNITVEPYIAVGYLQVTASGYLPQLVFWQPPTVENTSTSPPTIQTLPLVQQSLIAGEYSFAGIPYDSSLGSLIVSPSDCEGLEAGGVSFTADGLGPSAVLFYFYDGVPTTHAQATQLTSLLAAGGFANVTPGMVTVYSHAQGRVFSTQRVLVRGGAMTFALPSPTPN